MHPLSLYTIEPLKIPFDLPNGLHRINNLGQGIGTMTNENSISYCEGRTVDLEIATGTGRFRAASLNNLGQIVGVGDRGAAVIGNQEEVHLLRSSISPTDINDAGIIVGSSSTKQGPPRACLWDKGEVIDLGSLHERDSSYADSVNMRNQVVGESNGRAFLWEEGVMMEIEMPPRCNTAAASRINNTGTVLVLGRIDRRSDLSFLWRDGDFQRLETLGGRGCSAQGINNHGEIVGQAEPVVGEYSLPVIWNEGKPTLLSDLIPAGTSWKLELATDINDLGQITGVGSFKGKKRVPFLMTPRPKATDE